MPRAAVRGKPAGCGDLGDYPWRNSMGEAGRRVRKARFGGFERKETIESEERIESEGGAAQPR